MKKIYLTLSLFVIVCACIIFYFVSKEKNISDNRTPLVSVTIGSYNHEKFVEETILSIINQTYKNIELIVIDDGSSDKTFEIIQDTLKKYPNRFVRTDISKQKHGEEINNKLKDKSKGEYRYFIASDDVAYPEAIEKELNFLLDHPDYVIVVPDNRFIDENSNPVNVDIDLDIITSIRQSSFRSFAQRLFVKDVGQAKGLYSLGLFGDYDILYSQGNHVPNGYLVRNSALDNVTFTPKAPLEDYFMMLQLAKKGKFGYMDEVLFSYRRHAKNTARKENKKYMFNITRKTWDYENWLCIHEPFRWEYSFKINLYKLKCKLQHLIDKD